MVKSTSSIAVKSEGIFFGMLGNAVSYRNDAQQTVSKEFPVAALTSATIVYLSSTSVLK